MPFFRPEAQESPGEAIPAEQLGTAIERYHSQTVELTTRGEIQAQIAYGQSVWERETASGMWREPQRTLPYCRRLSMLVSFLALSNRLTN
jgi:hypothetical protein